MNYYTISHATDRKDVGHYEQIDDLTIKWDKAFRDKYHDLEESRREFHKEMPPLDLFKLSDLSTVTDILSSVFISTTVGLIVSKKCRELIEESNLTEHQFHPVKITGVEDKDRTVAKNQPLSEMLPYSFFYLIEESQGIDFINSEFYKTNFFGKKEEGSKPIKIASLEEFHRKNFEIQSNGPGLLSFTKIRLNRSLDIFHLPGGGRIYFSETCKNRFEEKSITGLEYKPCKIPVSFA